MSVVPFPRPKTGVDLLTVDYKHRALFTDFYELTMTQGYLNTHKAHTSATFELFFRNNPFKGGYAVVAGITDAMTFLENLAFTTGDLDFLRGLSLFSEEFLEYLAVLRFTGEVEGMSDGSLVFPYEPILQITGELGQLQLVETALLNIINYQTLIATKASRITREAAPGGVLEFGLRRAQGDGGVVGARAAMVGGCVGTSNTYAGKLFDIPVSGTHAHSWVQSFDEEVEAFRSYAQQFPHRAILLVDTYDTLKSGVPDAITVGLEMRERGEELYGIRIDSGDLAWLSVKAAELLDEAGLSECKIVLSNDLDEHIINSITNEIRSKELDVEFRERTLNRLVYGVGTNLITGGYQAALGGVFKLVQSNNHPVIKISENSEKTTNPGRKKLWRIKSKGGYWVGDVMTLYSEDEPQPGQTVYHPLEPSKSYTLGHDIEVDSLHFPLFTQGTSLYSDGWRKAQERYRSEISSIDSSHLRLLNPHTYKVSLSSQLFELKRRLIGEH